MKMISYSLSTDNIWNMMPLEIEQSGSVFLLKVDNSVLLDMI